MRQVSYWRNLSRRFDSKGWLPLLYDYTVDEPECGMGEDGRWDVLHRRAAMVKQADPRLRTLVTTTDFAARNNSALDLIDLWVPIINDLNSKSNCVRSCSGKRLPARDQRSSYDFVKQGNLFTYQSCMSYGCGPDSTCAKINESKCAIGWPSYAIDHVDRSSRPSGLVNRAMEWASYLENVDGELYYAVGLNFNMAAKTPGNEACWDTANFYGGNGDGYMLCEWIGSLVGSGGRLKVARCTDPGTPAHVGGKTGIPIESVRLKHVRDGFDDNAYLRLLEKATSREHALQHLNTFMAAPSAWVDDIAKFEAVRVGIGRAIEAAQGRTLAAQPIAKRIRWFVDGHNSMLSKLDQTFLFDTHADIVDGVYPCCGYGGIRENGTIWTFWDPPEKPWIYSPWPPKDRQKLNALYAKLLAQGKTVMLSINGGPLPPAAFERREALADEMLEIVLQHNLSGITLDFEGKYPDPKKNRTWGQPRATVAQFSATWAAVSRRLHAHGKTIGVCISNGEFSRGNANSTHPNKTQVVYTSAWAYPTYIPWADVITDMSTYRNSKGGPWQSWDPSPVRVPAGMHELEHWSHAEGLVLDQLANGVDAPSGQLSPGLWFDQCAANGSMTSTGWTQPYLRKLLRFLDSKGVRSVDVWTSNQTTHGERCQMPCPTAPTCEWVYTELRAWKQSRHIPGLKGDDDSAHSAPLRAVRTLSPEPIAKRIRWFVDGHNSMLSELDQTFLFDTHADIVDGVYPCCGFGGVNPNGTLWTFWDQEWQHPDKQKVEALYARLLAQGKTVMLSFGGPIDGGPLPPAAFERREALAGEMLEIVLQHNLSGITLDFEGRFPDPANNQTWMPRATVAQFSATWDAVSRRLHEHGKAIGVCIGDGVFSTDNINGSDPNMTQVVYTSAWAYPAYIPWADVITDMSTYWNGAPWKPWDPAPVRTPAGMHELEHWSHAEGLVLDQLANGVDAASGQLSPGLWFDQCASNGSMTRTGWTQPYLRKLLRFLDSKGVRSVDIWTSNQTTHGERCQMPCPTAPTCEWVYTELRTWKARKTAVLKNDDDASPLRAARATLQSTAPIDAAGVVYRASCKGATLRNLSAVLSDTLSVRDFGAQGDCFCTRGADPPYTDGGLPWPGWYEGSCCPHDDTDAFIAALAAVPDTTPVTTRTVAQPRAAVFVPPGAYRIDGTIEIYGQTLTLAAGASLLRTNLSSSVEPVVLLSNWFGALEGSGSVESVNPAPHGIVAVAPNDEAIRLREPANMEWNRVETIVIRGPGPSWHDETPDVAVNTELNGSIGLYISACRVPHDSTCKAAAYQNYARGVTILDIDTGVYLGYGANGNQISDVMMINIGQTAYLLDAASENVVSGGFVAGHGGNVTVIRGVNSTWHNFFVSILCEPGPGSRYFDFGPSSTANTVIGHDNDQYGSRTHDPSFTNIQNGKLQLGDFSNATQRPTGPGNTVMQVEGKAYIKTLEHGLPVRRVGLHQSTVEAVDDEPVLLSSTSTRHDGRHSLRIAGLGLVSEGLSACYYEVTLSGVAEKAGAKTSVFTGRYIVTPFRRPSSGAPALAVKALTPAGATALGEDSLSVAPRATAFGDEVELALDLPEGCVYELVVDTHRVGRGCATPRRVELKGDDDSARSAPLRAVRTLSPEPIAKRIRWFVDGHNSMLAQSDQKFMFDTHADIVDGVYPCCGFGGVRPNGTLWTFWDQNWKSGHRQVDALYAKLLAQGKTVMLSFNGGPLPPAAFERREALADEMLEIVLQHNLSGITLDFEGRFPDPRNNRTWMPRATVAQFSATWDAVSRRLHAHGKTIAVCIADGQVNSSVPNMTQVSYVRRTQPPFAALPDDEALRTGTAGPTPRSKPTNPLPLRLVTTPSETKLLQHPIRGCYHGHGHLPAEVVVQAHAGGKPPRQCWHLGCILPRVPAIVADRIPARTSRRCPPRRACTSLAAGRTPPGWCWTSWRTASTRRPASFRRGCGSISARRTAA
eukprot:COSAG04_NODE_257_length_18753_cov_7.516857_8_plen_1972_part_00